MATEYNMKQQTLPLLPVTLLAVITVKIIYGKTDMVVRII
jgi:hypothetical protein